MTDLEPSLEHIAGTRFALKRLLGEGGMGVVYHAVDRERNVEVALKTLRHRNPQDLYRFKLEFRSLQGIAHPNLVRLGELIEDQGRWLFTMELVRGVDFIRYVRPARLGPGWAFSGLGAGRGQDATPPLVDEARLRSTLYQLTQALCTLHRNGKVHRDIKPSNILVSTEGHVKLADFGIARAGTEQTTVAGSSAQKIKGTYPFIAPEIFEGAEPAPSTDVYACAVVLYVLLAGRNPFAAKSPRQTIRLVLDHDPQPIDAIREDVFPGLASALAKALAKDRHARYPDAASFAQALRGISGFDSDAAAEDLARLAAEDFLEPRFAQLLNVTDLTVLEDILNKETPSVLQTPAGQDAQNLLSGHDEDEWSTPTATVLPHEKAIESPGDDNQSRPVDDGVSIEIGKPVAESATARPAIRSQSRSSGAPRSPEQPIGQSGQPVGTGTIPAPSAQSTALVSSRHDRAQSTPSSPRSTVRWIIAATAMSVAALATALVLVLVLIRGGEGRQPAFVVVQAESLPAGATDRAERADAGLAVPATPVAAAPTVYAAVKSSVRPPAKSPGTGKKKLSRSRPTTAQKLSQTFRTRQAAIRACFAEHAVSISGMPQLSVRFRIDMSGTVKSAEVVPDSVARTELGQCIEGVARSTRFGRQDRERGFRIPVTVQLGR